MNNNINLNVTSYEKVHLDQVINLWKEHFDTETIPEREVLFKWLTEENPFTLEESPYFLLFHRNRVVGMHGHMPLFFSVEGKQNRGYLAHDDLMSPNYRGKGLGKILLKGVSEKAPSFAGALWFNEPNYRLYQKSGWLSVPDFYSFVKIIEPRYFIRKILRNQPCADIASFLIKTVLEIREKHKKIDHLTNINISEVERFDHRFDRLYHEISHLFGIIVIRDESYLNWKFVNKPFNNYKRYAAFDKAGELSGYIVIKKESYEKVIRGRILDILVDPARLDVFAALINKSFEEFSKVPVDYIEATCTYPPFTKLLKQYGFFQSRKPMRFMVCNWENHFPQDFIGKTTNWYLTNSDADGDAWSVDSTDIW